MAADDYDFKIGITYDPIQRWSLPGGPYCYDWEFMILLYAATTSEKEAPESSGRLEKRLIDTMWTLPRCHNKQNTGGLSPTPGRPHWCYCVFRKAEQLSSRDTMADTLFGKPIPFSMIERHRRWSTAIRWSTTIAGMCRLTILACRHCMWHYRCNSKVSFADCS